MKQLLQITLFIIGSILYSQIPEFEGTLVHTFSIGSGENELYYEPHIAGMDEHGPTSIGIDSEGKLYICDGWNRRIVVYDQDFQQKYSIFYEYYNMLNGADQLFIIDELLYGIGIRSSAMLGDMNGNTFFKIQFSNLPIQSVKINKNNYIGYNNYYFFYLTNGDINCVPPPDDTSTSWKEWKVLNNQETRTLFTAKIPELEGLSIDNDNMLYKDGKLYTRYYGHFYKYFSSLYDNWDVDNRHSIMPFPFSVSNSVYYIGEDKSGYTYWDMGGLIRVYSKDGFVKSIFLYSIDDLFMFPAVHPSGDLYYLKYDPEGMYLYKIERQW